MYCRIVAGVCLLIGLFCTTYGTGSYQARAAEPKTQWKAGVASAVITPEEPMWMAGYASRDKPSEGKVHDLRASALAFEDSQGSRLVIVTLDLISITRDTRDWLENQVGRAYDLRPESLLVNASHTHSGPEVRPGKVYLPKERAEQCRKYVDRLQDNLLKMVGRALDDLAPVSLSYTHARAGFSMNRRTPTESGFQNHPYPDGPVDQEVPVLLVKTVGGSGDQPTTSGSGDQPTTSGSRDQPTTSGSGDQPTTSGSRDQPKTGKPATELKAVLFGYACHSTTLGFYEFCGDYAGFAKQYLEESHPGTMALFVAGCGGDQNPYPRRTLELCKQHGRALANGVEAALQTTAKPVRGPLRTAIDEVVLEFATPPGREQLEKEAKSKNKWERRHAEALLKELDESGKLCTTYPTLVQVVRFGPDITMVALPGEVVVDYSLRLKSELAGPAVWVAGYSNDVFGYLPSVRVLNEGGYEGGGAMRYTTFPGPFAPSVESIVIEKVHELAKKTQIPTSTENSP